MIAGTLGEILAVRARDTPGAPVFAFSKDGEHDELALTFGELHDRAQAIAAQLVEAVEPGAHVLLLFGPGLDFPAALFACLQVGAVAVSALATQPGRLHRVLPRLERIAADAEVRAVLTTGATIDTDRALLGADSPLSGVPWIAVDAAVDVAGPGVPAQDPSGLAFLQYTSGSTTDPRAVMLTHAHFLANARMITESLRLSDASRGVCWLPASHDMGLVSGILAPVIAGFPTVLMPPLSVLKDPLRWLRAVTRTGATLSGGPNFAYELAVARTTPEQREPLSLSGWDVAFCGAEPIRAEAVDAFCDAYASCGFARSSFYPCYGLAEATLMVTGPQRRREPTLLAVDAAGLEARVVRPPGAREQVIVGVGEPGREHAVAIVDEETRRRCADATVGEIWVAGPSVAPGYWRGNGTGFAETIAGEPESVHYLRTGDLGFLRDGELFVVGRIKDLLIIRGRNFPAHDLEGAAESAHGALRPNCSAAFSADEGAGELATIVMEVDPGASEAFDAVMSAVRRAVMTSADVGLQWVVLVAPGAVPKTTSGKIQRRLCRSRLLDGVLEPLAQWRQVATRH